MSGCVSAAAAAFMFLALVLWTGCGDVFRPVANPIPGPTTDPRNYHVAIVISQNAGGNPGSGMQIDVSGDSNIGVVQSGQQPIFAAMQPGSNRVYVSNTDGSITTFIPAGIVGSIGAPSTITLPASLVPGFLFSTETGTMYAATSGPDTVDCPTAPNTGAVIAINAGTITIENVICVHPNPTVLTETPDGRKLYSVNSDGTLSSINTVDKSVNPAISTTLTQPIAAIASLDSSKIFVLDATGFIWTINTFTDQVSQPVQVSSGANSMALDSTHNRLYVTNPGSGTPSLLILDASNPALPSLTSAPLSLPPAATPVSVSFLPNGTSAYVLSVTSTNSPVVTVINTSGNTILSTINLPSATINPSASICSSLGVHAFSMATAGNNSRLYVSNCYAGSTNIIDTSTNTRILTMNSPTSAYPPVSGTNFPPAQNPVFVVAGP